MAELRPVSEMKDSGIEWVGQIPNNWKTIPNKYLMHKEKDLCEEWTGQDVMSLTMNGVIVRDLVNPSGKMPVSFDGYQFIKPGDLLMCLFDIDVTPRCVGRVFHEGVTSPAYSNFKLHENASLGYYFYYYLMLDHTKELLHLAKNLRHSFTAEQLGQLKVPMPPLAEQQAIADYLDDRCSKIDEIIAEATASIEEYKKLKQAVIFEAVTKGLDKNVPMKDSGIEWIGKVPYNWNIMPIKYLKADIPNSFVDGPFGSNLKSNHYIDNGDVYIIESGFISTGKFIYKPFKTISYDHFCTIKRSECKGGDVIIAKIGANYGMCAEMPQLDKPSVVSGNSLKITIDETKINKFLFVREMELAKKCGAFHNIVGSTAQPALSLGGLNDFRLAVPPIEMQESITNYIEKEYVQIDNLIFEKQSFIDDLQAYKKSLIYEVVTGKRRVV